MGAHAGLLELIEKIYNPNFFQIETYRPLYEIPDPNLFKI